MGLVFGRQIEDKYIDAIKKVEDEHQYFAQLKIKKGVEMLEDLVKEGCINAYHSLYIYYKNTDNREGQIDIQDQISKLVLGHLYGEDGFSQDIHRAIEILKILDRELYWDYKDVYNDNGKYSRGYKYKSKTPRGGSYYKIPVVSFLMGECVHLNLSNIGWKKIACYNVAYNGGHIYAAFRLFECFNEFSNRKAFEWLEISVNMNITDAFYRYGIVYLQGKTLYRNFIIKKNEKKALNIFKRGSKKGCEDCKEMVAELTKPSAPLAKVSDEIPISRVSDEIPIAEVVSPTYTF